MATFICEVCGHEWTVEIPPEPLNCPVCGGAYKIKPPPDPDQPKKPTGS